MASESLGYTTHFKGGLEFPVLEIPNSMGIIKTIAFIGSDKNSGKTTAMNFVYRQLLAKSDHRDKIILTSIGLNGEMTDEYEASGKPSITLLPGVYFVTATEHLKHLEGKFEIERILNTPQFKKVFIVGKCLLKFNIILEGPNERREVLLMKEQLSSLFPAMTLLVDGSIDRQFIAHPLVSDCFYFSLLLTDRIQQLRKAENLLVPLSFPLLADDLKFFLQGPKAAGTHEENEKTVKSLLFKSDMEILHSGKTIPFLDKELPTKCAKNCNKKLYLYLNGALSQSLYKSLSSFDNLNIILDNFTLYHNISTCYSREKDIFKPSFFLFHQVRLKGIFVKQGGLGLDEQPRSLLPDKSIPVYNLYREDLDEIGIRTEYS